MKRSFFLLVGIVVLVVLNSCKKEPPEADFVANKTNITVGETVTFTDKSKNNPTSWSWNFGNGNTSTQQNPTQTYNVAGSYTVSLTVSNKDGSDTETKPNYITVTSGSTPNTVTDIDGNVYSIVKIGNQWWMKENLRTTKYRNGTPISYPGADNSAWSSNTDGAYAWYNNDISNKNIYGALYNLAAVTNPAGLCPTGWHVPSDAEWQALVDYLGGSSIAGGKMKEVGTTYWNAPNTGATNESGFSARPGGDRGSGGSFNGLHNYGAWWSSASAGATGGWARSVNYTSTEVFRTYHTKAYGFSVRCVKD